MYGTAPITLAATASSGLPVTYTVSGPATISAAILTITGTGSVTVTANVAGNTDYTAGTAVPQSFTVSAATPTLTFAAIPSQICGGGTVCGECHVIELYRSDHLLCSERSGYHFGQHSDDHRSGHGRAAGQSGSGGNYAAATAITSFTVSAGTPKLSFVVPNQTYGVTPFAVNATSNSTGAITYSVVSGPATISGSTATITGVGTVVLQASQAAAGNYTAATSTTSFTVSAEAPKLSFAVPTQTYGGGSVRSECYVELQRHDHPTR